MTKTSNSPITVEEKNRWLGKLAFAALVALKLANGMEKRLETPNLKIFFCFVGYKQP